ncbi:MAG: hypothetical protein U0745_21390 [Polyangia bacterium]
MIFRAKSMSLAMMSLGLLLGSASSAEAQTVEQVPNAAPAGIPAGMKVTCTPGPGTGAAAPSCPILKMNGLTYWAFSYSDNRVAMGIVAYDAAGKVVAQWEKPGARYVYAIKVDAAAKTVTFMGQADQKITMTFDALSPVVGLPCGKNVRLKSWKNDFLTRTAQAQGVTTTAGNADSSWKVECSGTSFQLKSTKGDYLHRPDGNPAVTTWSTGPGNVWTSEIVSGKVQLKSWKGDYLHRPDGNPAVTTWGTGVGNQWTVEPLN